MRTFEKGCCLSFEEDSAPFFDDVEVWTFNEFTEGNYCFFMILDSIFTFSKSELSLRVSSGWSIAFFCDTGLFYRAI